MTYAYPWAFALPALVILIALYRQGERSGILFPSTTTVPVNILSLRFLLRTGMLTILSCAFLYFLTLAAARPQIITRLPTNFEARNIMLALDVSGSMRTRDFHLQYRPSSRLEAVKAVVQEFIEGRPGDRLGLVLFGSNAYLECPLTTDHDILIAMVKELEVGIAGDGTALGDGMGIALKRIQHIEGKSRAIILLTDGVQTAGTVNPLQAAQVAKDLGIKVHTIGIGSTNTASRARMNPMLGGTKQFEFDEKTLTEIASITGGVYFNAANIEELQKVYAQIDALERSTQQTPQQPLVHELYPQQLQYALLCFVLYLLVNNVLLPRVPW